MFTLRREYVAACAAAALIMPLHTPAAHADELQLMNVLLERTPTSNATLTHESADPTIPRRAKAAWKPAILATGIQLAKMAVFQREIPAPPAPPQDGQNTPKPDNSGHNTSEPNKPGNNSQGPSNNAKQGDRSSKAQTTPDSAQKTPQKMVPGAGQGPAKASSKNAPFLARTGSDLTLLLTAAGLLAAVGALTRRVHTH